VETVRVHAKAAEVFAKEIFGKKIAESFANSATSLYSLRAIN